MNILEAVAIVRDPVYESGSRRTIAAFDVLIAAAERAETLRTVSLMLDQASTLSEYERILPWLDAALATGAADSTEETGT